MKFTEAYLIRSIPDMIVRDEGGHTYRLSTSGHLARIPAFDMLDLSRYGIPAPADMLMIYGVRLAD